MPRFRFLPALALLAGLASSAHAQNVEAETLFLEGEKLLAEGKFIEACDAFAASNRIEPRAGTLINLAVCQEKRQRLASAWIAYREALTRVKDPVKKTYATEHAAALEPRLSSVTIELPDASRVDGLIVTRDGQPVDAALFGHAVPVDGGSHTVEAKAPGRKAWTKSVDVALERDRVTVSIPALEVETASAPIGRAGGSNHHGMALAFGGIGVAALGVGIWAGLSARGLDDDAKALCPTPGCAMASEANALLDRRDTRALIANVGFGVAAAGAIAATIAIMTGHSSSQSDVVVVTHPGGAGIQVRIGF